MRKNRIISLFFSILLVLTMSAMWTIPALADEGTPAPETPATEVSPADTGSTDALAASAPADPTTTVADPTQNTSAAVDPVQTTPTEAAPTEVAPTDAAPASASLTEVAPADTAPADGKPAEEPATLPELLDQIPVGTDVTVVDVNGNTLPLASQDAANAILNGDPIWCPVGVTPNSGGGLCSSSFASLQDLVNGFVPTANGVIWIQSGVYLSTTPIIINGASGENWASAANFSLTLKGGWNGNAGSTTVNGTSELHASLSITNWNADVTLSDILITNVSGSSSTALNIDTTKKVTLTRVHVEGNDGAGAKVDNCKVINGACTSANDVTVTSSSFSSNKNGFGLDIYSGGAITLSDVIADSNGGLGIAGARLDNSDATTAKSVTLITGNLEFNDNAGGDGLEIWSKGNVTLKDITANSNGGDGAFIDNTAGSGTVTLTGTNIFSENTITGLVVYSKGAVTASNLIANGNSGGRGAYINNSDAATPQNVTLTGRNEFKFNNTGLYILSDGAITLNNITATYNNGTCNNCGGVYLDNATFSPVASTAGIILTGSNIFSNNSMTGLQVFTKGVVTLNNITANDNGWYDSDSLSTTYDQYFGQGAYINNAFGTTPKIVSLLGTNTFSGNATDGLVVYSKGTITANNITASFNGWAVLADLDPTDGSSHGDGAYLDNCLINNNGTPLDPSDDYCTTPLTSSIALTGTNTFNNNYWGSGLIAQSIGLISVNNLTANNNGWDGAHLDNDWMYWDAIAIPHTYKFPGSNVTISGYSKTSDNGNRGLAVFSTGNVSIATVTANDNGSKGVYIFNAVTPSAPKTVSLIGISNTFNRNGDTGLDISSYGAVSLNNLTANGNGGNGVNVVNSGATLPQAVTITGNNTFRGNTLDGLTVISKGAISANNLIASDNGGDGTYLDNQVMGAIGAVSVTNTATYSPEFARNGLDGLVIYSNGNITVMDLDASQNGQLQDPDWGYGVYLVNAGTGTGNVILGTARANWKNYLSDNFLSGLEVYSNGTVSLSNIQANSNGDYNSTDTSYVPYGYGVFIANDAVSSPKNVTLLGTNIFDENASGGFYAYTKGAIILNNVEANGNGALAEGGDGVHLENWDTTLPQPVTLNGVNNFNGNYNNGLQVLSRGAITVSKITADSNGDGAELYNDAPGAATSPQNVTVTGFGEFNNNYNNGLDINSYGAITIANITADNNGQRSIGDTNNGFGAFLDNSGGTVIKPVTITGNNSFNDNLDGGLEVHSLGAISLNNASGDNNGSGIWLDNNILGALGGVTITTGVWTSDNDTFGMDITTKGAITINVTDAYAANNGTHGWLLVNNFTGVPGVTLTSPNPDWAFDFSDNGDYGLWIQSLGTINITGLDASGNGNFGALLDNAFTGSIGTVTVTTTTGRNEFNGNTGTGLLIYSNRAITINNLFADSNGYSGVVLDNTYSNTGVLPAITINGSGEFYNNGDTGLEIYTYGPIVVNNITANDNGQAANSGTGWGAYLDNCNYGLSNCTAVTPSTVTLNGTNAFENNYQDGLFVASLGAIKANNLSASGNTGAGAYLENQWNFSNQAITLTGANTFNENGLKGLGAWSNGSITINNLTANGNMDDGAYLDTYSLTGTSVPVTLTGTNTFIGNGDTTVTNGIGDGLVVRTDGQITINNLTANWNEGAGVYLNNWDYWYNNDLILTLPGLKLTGANTFNSNGGDGLYFDIVNTVDLSKVTADRNSGSGVYGYAGGNITMACSSMTQNVGYGWWLSAWNYYPTNLVTLSGVFAYSNGTNTWLDAGRLNTIRTCTLP